MTKLGVCNHCHAGRTHVILVIWAARTLCEWLCRRCALITQHERRAA